ncbi:hypothetical protein ALC60_10117 [Trachymyrmex zeteki]|uniref:Uncharacterized protein n=1 Tax=Mycetomoellerius zeteki TaxID=64791 RepID=A0A151WSJ6_9HYME|nr:hypothetical protein ALC60_10117 [Trachymyrmex zeteki]
MKVARARLPPPATRSRGAVKRRHQDAYLQRQFPGSIKNCNSRFSSRYGTSSVVSLPVGRHYPGASRSLLYAAKEWYRVDGRRGKRTRTHAHRRCVCTRIHARYRGSNSPRCHEEGDRVNELPFCGPPDVFFLLIGMRAGIRRDQARCKRKIGGDDITADRRNDRNSSFGFGVEDDGRRRPYGKLIAAEEMVGVRHATNLYLKRLADILDIEITQRDIRGTSIVRSSKKSLHNDQPIYGRIIVTYRSYSIRRRGERTEEEEEEEKEEEEEEDGLYLFGRREGRPSDSIRYKKGRRTPSARMRKVMSRKITGRRRKGGYIGIVRPTEREPGLTIGMFSGSDTEGQEEGKKGGTPHGRVFIGLLCQSYSSTGRKPNWYCRHLFRRDLLSKAVARPRPCSYFSSHPLKYFFIFLNRRHITPGNMTLFRKRGKSCLFHSRNKRHEDSPAERYNR